MNLRLVESKDIEQLIKMRWDFTLEDDTTGKVKNSDYQKFHNECNAFLLDAINSNKWSIWVADNEGEIVSHIYIELIHKVPRPGRTTYPFAYMTNVYTLPNYRGKGIGSSLITKINEWAEEQNYEFIIVWPSDEGVDFYRRNGYKHCVEPMEYVF